MAEREINLHRNVILKDNIITLNNLTNTRLIIEFINAINGMIYKFNHKKIIVDCRNVSSVYAFPAVPIIGIMDYYKEQNGIDFNVINLNRYLRSTNFSNPKTFSSTEKENSDQSHDKFWSFSTSGEISNIVDAYTKFLMRTAICEEGVLLGSIWSINEVMDNVIQHSGIGKGFVMIQLLNKNTCLNVCIYDYGLGIFKTLSNSIYKPKSAVDAITMCIKEGVTRDKKIGQGNGLWGLHNIISQNNGRLNILSGKGGMFFYNSGQMARPSNEIVILNKNNQSTTVHFALVLNNKVSLKEALKGHEIIDMNIENLKIDSGDIIYRIADVGSGTGTRESGLLMKNELINIYKCTNRSIIIDFDGVGIISSSFADEFVGKLIDEIGFYQYQSIFKLVNMNKNIQPIFEASLKKRMSHNS